MTDETRHPARQPGGPPARCCSDEDIARLEWEGVGAEDDLEAWLEEGPRETTQELIDVIVDHGIEGATLLDVGAGVGTIHISLLEAGAARAVDIDLSREYLRVAREEAVERGLVERIEHRYGDVVALAADDGGLPPADVVTADAVICCYPYLPEFVDAVVSVGPRIIGLTYPSDAWWSRAELHALNLWWTLTRHPDRWHVHRRREVDRLFRDAGYRETYWGGTRGWKVVVYERR
jgi:magnesium-protoporphyrin O-methyltransferase